jgi:methyl-accepting chemotaxis protein
MEHSKPRPKNRNNFEPSCGSAQRLRLQSRVRVFVTLIICTYVIFSLVMLFEVSGYSGPRPRMMERDPLKSAIAADGENPVEVAGRSYSQAHRWIWFAILITAAALFATYFYTRKLLGPLDEVRLTAGRVARGELNRTAAIRNNDEIGAIAESINDIAANQQEILLHLWNQTGHSLDLIDRISSGIVNACPNDGLVRVKKDLSSVRHSMESLRALADDVGFYQVRLQDAKVHATSECKTGGSRKTV